MTTTQLPKLTPASIRAAIAAATSLQQLAFELNIAEQFAFDAGINVDELFDLHALPDFGGEPDTRGYSWDLGNVLVYAKIDGVSTWAVRPRSAKPTVAMKKPANFASLKVEYFPDAYDTDSVATILIRATGEEGLAKAKSRARDLSKSTETISYVVGNDEDGTSIGHISYSDGRIAERAGCFA